MSTGTRKDLIILVADKDAEQTLHGLLKRNHSLGIREITYDIIIHTNRDNGCATNSVEYLRIFLKNYTYAITVFDKDGSGQEHEQSTKLYSELKENLQKNGWENRCEVIIIEPELEQWIWASSNKLPAIISWNGDYNTIQNWLTEKGMWLQNQTKPSKPKESFQMCLRRTQTRVSSSLFLQIAEQISFKNCTDTSFNLLKNTLQLWFPIE